MAKNGCMVAAPDSTTRLPTRVFHDLNLRSPESGIEPTAGRQRAKMTKVRRSVVPEPRRRRSPDGVLQSSPGGRLNQWIARP